MRVVAGSAGGIPLQIPKHDLRPTMDKVKAAIFSSLAEKVIGARVLDLFSGSGAMGIEALSRGAVHATLIESDVRAVDCIQANLKKTRLEGKVLRDEVFRFLKRNSDRFDLVFADPPYSKTAGARDFCSELWHSPDLVRALQPDGILVLERAPAELPPPTSLFELLRQKRYGASEVLFFRVAESDPAKIQ